MKGLSILGSTGSVGTNVLRIVESFADRLRVVGLSAGNNVERLAAQVAAHRPAVVSVATAEAAGELGRLVDLSGVRVGVGSSGAVDVATHEAARTVDLQLAHALARQGRAAEALAALAPAMEYFRARHSVGAAGTDRRLRYAEALYVSALAQGTDAAGQRARQQALRAASAELAGLSDEVQQLRGTRELAALVAGGS